MIFSLRSAWEIVDLLGSYHEKYWKQPLKVAKGKRRICQTPIKELYSWIFIQFLIFPCTVFFPCCILITGTWLGFKKMSFFDFQVVGFEYGMSIIVIACESNILINGKQMTESYNQFMEHSATLRKRMSV